MALTAYTRVRVPDAHSGTRQGCPATGRTNMLELSFEEAVSLAEALVEEYGADHVYEMPAGGVCVYANPEDSTPSCGVGHILARKGVPIERLAQADSIQDVEGFEPIGTSAHTLLRELKDEGILSADPKATAFLSAFQFHQDDEVPWGEALDDARKHSSVY
jgi:hypothetical protein